MHDIFISYEHQSKTIADNIVNYLETRKIRCWYAPRDVIGDYATSICDAISKCKIFVLVLNEYASNSQHCLNEVEMAYLSSYENDSKPIIIPIKIDDKELNLAMQYYVKRLHWIDATTNSLDFAINELYKKIASILNLALEKTDISIQSYQRRRNTYDVADEKEKERLNIQLAISKDFDQPTYDKAVIGKESISVLDVGGNNGLFVMDRLGQKNEVLQIIGLEYDETAVESANKNFPEKCRFYQCDVEGETFEFELKKILNENNISSFDIINISMLILHLKNPTKVLKILRRYLKIGGTIIIKDIDDGLTFCYPDTNGNFAKAIELCSLNSQAGYRHSGREIYTLLTNTGYKEIVFENACLSNVGFDYDKKQSLFEVYFGFIFNDFEYLSQNNPENTKIVEGYKWLKDNLSELEESYYMSNFIFNLGFVLFSAKK